TTQANADLINLNQFRSDPQFAGITGQGETIAVLDTGIDSTSSFFGPLGANGTANSIVYQYDFVNNSPMAVDGYGHGTLVSSIIGSRNSDYEGIAPGVNLIVLKVLDDSGQGSFSTVDRALRWVAANAEAYHIVGINMSFGDGGDYANPVSLYGIGNDLQTLAS